MRIAKRMKYYQTHYFAGLAAKIDSMRHSGADIIRLDEGSPDLPPPKEVIQELIRSANLKSTHSYQSHLGTRELREAWSNMYMQLYGVGLDPEQEVVPLIGSKEGIVHFPLVLIDPGDVVLVPDPGYITYTRGASLAGAEIFSMPLTKENDYLPDLESIPSTILERVKLLWLNYPNNPTAAFASLEFFKQVIEFARHHKIIVCHDAAYTQVTFTGKPAPSILQVEGASEVAVEFNTLSKSHNMAGWRVGVIVGNSVILQLFLSLKSNFDSGHFLPIMDAAEVALSYNQHWIHQRNEEYKLRKDIVIKALRRMNLSVDDTLGSLYVWCRTHPDWNSIDFANLLLEKAHISVTPGVVFGKNGEGYIRISITAPNNRIEEAMVRMEEVLTTTSKRIG